MRAETLIVSRTWMKGSLCIGGLTKAGRSVRLLERGNRPPPPDAPYQVGERWELEFIDRNPCEPPHVEDIIVLEKRRLGQVNDLANEIRGRTHPWEGAPEALYDGHIRSTRFNGRGFVSDEEGLPDVSTGFWIPDLALTLIHHGEKPYYSYPQEDGVREISYVGVAAPITQIPAGTLVRVSLSRRFPKEDPKCWLQLSGWYL
jgi:hypothetical protein